MKEYIFVHMVEPLKIGDRFTMWPLHMTLLPWFDAPDVGTVEARISEKTGGVKPFEVAVGEKARFGRHQVVLVKNTPELQDLHEKLLQVIHENAWTLRGRYTGEHFKPHVTQKAGRNAGGVLKIDSVYIAEKQPQGYREIAGKIDL